MQHRFNQYVPISGVIPHLSYRHARILDTLQDSWSFLFSPFPRISYKYSQSLLWVSSAEQPLGLCSTASLTADLRLTPRYHYENPSYHFNRIAFQIRPLTAKISTNSPRPATAAKRYLTHIPDTIKNVSNIQHINKSAAQAPSPRHRTRQLRVLFRRKGPQKDDRDGEHLHTSHERGRAYRKVEDGNVLRAMEPVVLGEELEDGRLGECDADDALEGPEFVDD